MLIVISKCVEGGIEGLYVDGHVSHVDPIVL